MASCPDRRCALVVTILYLQINSISRGAGRRVVAAAAYRAGERIRDERNGLVHNFSKRTDVTHKEILLPTGIDANQLGWATDRAQLWNAAERAEHRRNARVAREFQIGLPHELSADQRRDLARTFAREMSDRYKVAVDLAIHDPRPEGDPRNFHAHLLLTSREMTATGFAGKAGLDLSSAERQRRGLLSSIPEYRAVRERWANLTNEALLSAGLDLRVDHRTLRAQGIERVPRPHIPYSEVLRERRGLRSEVAERIRAKHLARVQAHQRQDITPEAAGPQADSRASTIEDVRQRAREAWLQLRREAAKGRSNASRRELAAEQSIERPAIEDDLAL
jgi:hypothetical protein